MRTLPLLLLLLAASAQPAPAAREGSASVSGGALRGRRRGLIHPLLDTEDFSFKEVRPFKFKLEKLRERLQKEKKITVMALYFRDLDNGLAFGIDQQTPFLPASLLKLPVMLALLKKHEYDPQLLERRVALRAAPAGEVAPVYPPSKRLTPGKEYTVDELLTAMIGRSDNDATNTLLGALSVTDYTRVFDDLALRIPNVRDENDPITVREYAAFFRILYNASYLDKDRSQKALEYLAAAEFDHALRAGVPKPVVVAHKFGEAGREDAKERQLHDCGIVYHPETPYVLCVMTRGEDTAALAAAIREASRITYEAVNKTLGSGPR